MSAIAMYPALTIADESDGLPKMREGTIRIAASKLGLGSDDRSSDPNAICRSFLAPLR